MKKKKEPNKGRTNLTIKSDGQLVKVDTANIAYWPSPSQQLAQRLNASFEAQDQAAAERAAKLSARAKKGWDTRRRKAATAQAIEQHITEFEKSAAEFQARSEARAAEHARQQEVWKAQAAALKARRFNEPVPGSNSVARASGIEVYFESDPSDFRRYADAVIFAAEPRKTLFQRIVVAILKKLGIK